LNERSERTFRIMTAGDWIVKPAVPLSALPVGMARGEDATWSFLWAPAALQLIRGGLFGGGEGRGGELGDPAGGEQFEVVGGGLAQVEVGGADGAVT
jgi:hypothetical protein